MLPDGRTTRITELLRDRRFLLLDLEADRPTDPGIATGRMPVNRVKARAGKTHAALHGAKRLLVRPDAYVAWAGDGATPQELSGWLREMV